MAALKAQGDNLEQIVYSYYIRGWLTSINKNTLLGPTQNYFGMELAYDNGTSIIPGTGYAHPTFNGNIAGITWKSAGDGVARRYVFTYDDYDLFTTAPFF